MDRKIKELVTDGKANYGSYHGMIKSINMLDRHTDYYIPKFIKNLRLKEWQAIQIFHKDFFLITAVLNAKSFGIVQSIIIDRVKHKKHVFHKNHFTKHVVICPNLFDSVTEYEDEDHFVQFRNHADKKLFNIDIHHEKNSIQCMGQGSLSGTPLSIYYPFINNNSLYTCKMAMPFEGQIIIDGQVKDIRDAVLIIDDHKGFYPYHMKYQWATAASNTDELIAFNFTNNDLINSDTNNENVLWLNDEIHHFKTTHIKASDDKWIIEDVDKKVYLEFTPEYDYSDHHNYGLVQTHYSSPVGYFKGTIMLKDRVIEVNNWYGMTEDINHKI